MDEREWYGEAYKKEVTLKYRTLSGRYTGEKKGRLQLPSYVGISLEIDTYLPAGGTYIFEVSYDRIISVEFQNKIIYQGTAKED